MSGTRLTREHELSLLKKLSTDDDYRARFEKDPPAALKEIGVAGWGDRFARSRQSQAGNSGRQEYACGRLPEAC